MVLVPYGVHACNPKQGNSHVAVSVPVPIPVPYAHYCMWFRAPPPPPPPPLQVRWWASLRAQTLGRTVFGLMEMREALVDVVYLELKALERRTFLDVDYHGPNIRSTCDDIIAWIQRNRYPLLRKSKFQVPPPRALRSRAMAGGGGGGALCRVNLCIARRLWSAGQHGRFLGEWGRQRWGGRGRGRAQGCVRPADSRGRRGVPPPPWTPSRPGPRFHSGKQ